MKKKIMFAAIVAMAMVAVGKGTGAPAEDEVLVKFLEGYYLAPDAAEAIAKIPYFEKSVKKSRSATSPMSGFYFGVVKISPERKNEWLAAKEATKARWLKGAIDSGLDGKSLAEVVGEDPKALGPGHLDFMWGYFFATGDREAPRRIIKRGSFTFPEEATIDLTQRAAQWSALSIAKEHKQVQEELETFVRTATDDEVRAFFGGEVPDYAKAFLSKEAVARAESLKPVEKKEADEKAEEETAEPPPPEVRTESYAGYVAAREGEATLVFPGMTIEELADGEFSGMMGGAWVNGGEGLEAKGYNKEYQPGEKLRVQFQCIDKGDGKEYVKCVRAVFTDSPEGVRAVCDYTGFVTLGYKKNALGYDFRDDANWKAVASADGQGYGLAAVSVAIPVAQETEANANRKLPAGFTVDYDAARERAKANGRDLFLLFTGSDWCTYCKKLEKEVLSKSAFLDYATNEFECVVLDFPKDASMLSAKERRRNRELQEKFEVRGYPLVLIVSAGDESIKSQGGYERGGAEKWVENFKKELRLAPLRGKYFKELFEELQRSSMAFAAELEKIGRPKDAETAERIKALFAKRAEDLRDVESRLKALEVPEELAEEKDELLKRVAYGMERSVEIAEASVEEILESAADGEDEGDDEDDDAEDNDEEEDEEAAAPLALPLAGAGAALDWTEEVFMPFAERLLAKPEQEMLGAAFSDMDMAAVVREYAISRAPKDVNRKSLRKDYAADATAAWERGARTPFVVIEHTAQHPKKIGAEENAAVRRETWGKWKDDPRWPLASRILFIADWREHDGKNANELTQISVALKKKFIVSGEWKPEEIVCAWWTIAHQRGNNKMVFEELKAEGAAFDPWLEAVAMAYWHIDRAWEARGSGFASTVTEEGWKGYGEHRAKALEWAEKAYALRPDLASPTFVGLKANYGNRAEALKWYRRAAALFKDDALAADQFVWGMRPRWGGSTLDMMAFFRMFLSDDFADTLMPAWAIDKVYWDVFKEETYRGKERNFEEWAENNAEVIRHFSDIYMNGGYLKRKGVSIGARRFVADTFLAAAWSMGDMEMFDAWRNYDGAKAKEEKLTYIKAVKNTTTWRNAGMRALADWVRSRPDTDRRDLLHALRHAFGQWEPMRKSCRDHTHETRNYEPFEKLILPLIYRGEVSKDNTPDLQWGFLRYLAGCCIGTKALAPDGCELAGIFPKNLWADIDEKLEEITVEFELTVDGPETKGEGMMHFEFGSSAKDFYQRFSVLAVANKTDEKDNRFAILPWPKGETNKVVKVVFRGRDVKVYDNGHLAYTRQLRDGAQNVKKFSFARSNSKTVPFRRIFIKAVAAPPED